LVFFRLGRSIINKIICKIIYLNNPLKTNHKKRQKMETNNDVPRMLENTNNCNPVTGIVSWSQSKSIWLISMYLISIVGGYLTFSLEHLAVFIISTAVTLCLGHSLGMHRRFIHNSYETPLWIEYLFVHFGVLVGLAGPFGMMKTHDLRDWAQRKNECHDYLKHGKGFWHDGWWQLHCEIALDHPPTFSPEPRVANDKVYHWMEKTWMWQQLPWAILFGLIGGLPWVIWGICMRVAVSVTGHWLIGYFAHNKGHRDWQLDGAAVQGHNILFAGLITMGECWHNNHHAFPGSAKLGHKFWQLDPGWWVLCVMKWLGLAWAIKTPADMPHRAELVAI
jgi:fatty-acid desaturase